jgi:hypothetical protein
MEMDVPSAKAKKKRNILQKPSRIRTLNSTHIVQINVDSSVMAQDKVLDDVHSLDRIPVAFICRKEPRILFLNEFFRPLG